MYVILQYTREDLLYNSLLILVQLVIGHKIFLYFLFFFTKTIRRRWNIDRRGAINYHLMIGLENVCPKDYTTCRPYII